MLRPSGTFDPQMCAAAVFSAAIPPRLAIRKCNGSRHMDLLVWLAVLGVVMFAVYSLAPYHTRMIDHRDMQKAWDDWD
jgi:hypothetical protein